MPVQPLNQPAVSAAAPADDDEEGSYLSSAAVFGAPTPPAPVAAPSPNAYLSTSAVFGAPPPAPFPTEAPTGNWLDDAGNFLRTAAIKAGAGIAGMASDIGATALRGQTANAPGFGGGGWIKPTPTSQFEADAFNSKLGPEYVPQTEPGKLAMGATTGALTSLAMPWGGPEEIAANMVRGALAGAGAQGAQDEGMSPWIGAVAEPVVELLARGGYGAVKATAPLLQDVGRAVFSPARTGAVNAGRVVSGIDNTGAALPTVTDADLANATGAVQNATRAATAGAAEPWQAGEQIREDLVGRQAALKAARGADADAAYDAFRQEAAVPSKALRPFMSSPSFRGAIRAANGAILDEGGKPLTDYWDFDEAGDPIRLKNAAVPPDVLDRVRSQLGAGVGAAAPGPAQRTASILADRFDQFLGQQYPGYAEMRQDFADASRSLDPLNTGAPARVIASTRPYGGEPQYALPAERVPDLFLRGPATKTNLDQLVAAYGGDKNAAEAGLGMHLAGVAQQAVNGDGTFDAQRFAQVMKPYQTALNGNGGAWFPRLRAAFGRAQAAQQTLDALGAQRSVGDSLMNGELRDNTGNVTAASFNRWLNANKDRIATAQGPGSVIRLQQLGRALKTATPRNGKLIEESIPAAIGLATGGIEGGLFGGLLHNVSGVFASPWTSRISNAFSSAIENAVRDPAYARELVGNLPRGPITARGMVQTVAKTLGRAPSAAPRTVFAGSAAAPSN